MKKILKNLEFHLEEETFSVLLLIYIFNRGASIIRSLQEYNYTFR
jgi:hypothetical protein